MSLREIDFKGLYDSDKDNLLEDFYIPALSESVFYKRIAGFFSSNALAIAAKGIKKFINNGGKIQLIANVILSERDQKEIKKAITEKEENVIDEIDNLKDVLEKDHVKLLGWMIKNDKLEIKIAVVPGGLEHKKKGILEDEEGNIVSFSGSENETLNGWLYNDEEFHVFCSWIDGDKTRHLEPDIEGFDSLWENKTSETRVYSVSDAFKKSLIKIAPKDDEEFRELSEKVSAELLKRNKERVKILGEKTMSKSFKLRYYQKDAIDNWLKNDYNGYFEMATGTGKTITAIYAVKKLIETKPSLGIIIAVPSNPLISQWKKELKDAGFNESFVVLCSSNYDWNKTFTRYVMLETEQNKFFVFTYQSLADEEVQELINSSARDFFIICDEMHHAGAPKFSKCLNAKIKYRLGLSATPIRKYDIEGNQLLLDYFGKEPRLVFDIERALKEVNPDDPEHKTYLCNYDYHFESVELSENEHEEYKRLSRLIAIQKQQSIDKEEGQADKQRALLISCASEKMAILDLLVKRIKKLGKNKKMLFYCQSSESKDLKEKQIDSVTRILKENKLDSLEFTYKFDDPVFRDFILNALKTDAVDAIVSIKCLDEGIDLPEIRTAIILASTSNSAQFIQRRGRILRNAQGKNKAEIYDFVVGPPGGIKLKDSDLSLIRREYDRAKEYGKYSLNHNESAKELNRWLSKYDLVEEDLNENHKI